MNTDRFYTICSQSLESAKREQYDDNSPDALRINLQAQAKAFDINWGPASDFPDSMLDPGVDKMNEYIEQAVACLNNYQARQA